jgi:hypothetical protein
MTFDHRAHVRAGWDCIARYGLAAAVERLPAYLLGLATASGAPERYHETVTWAWLLLIADRMVEGEDFEAFAERNPELFVVPSILDRYWRPETLASERARQRFVFPDRLGQ